MSRTIQPGLIVLHGNRLELLRDAVFDWLDRHPLDPLEEEIFLVQSNGAGEWLKMSLARAAGICAATRVELPGRFLWRAYRAVLGRQRVPKQSPLDRQALTWRLMRLLPQQLARRVYAPVASFLAEGDADRRLQLARRLADLYDQYQVYRADWLTAWEGGRPVMPAVADAPDGEPVPADQRWQVELWRAITGELTRDERRTVRPHVHVAFLDALASDLFPAEPLPRRVVLFGASHIPVQGLQALAALSAHLQVVVAVPNPCRYHWADIIEGRDALRAINALQSRRHPSSTATDLATTPLESMHLHAHPLLAAWGRQGRDFMRQLDAYDDTAEALQRFDLPRLDLFDEGPGRTMLEQVQAAIRDLLPLAEHPARRIDAADRSIVFNVAHGPQREVEILHDQLLDLFARPADADGRRPPGPRDVIVMVPDIEVFAPAIRAVFGQHRPDAARYVPYEIADLRSRGSNPLVVALEWLLRIPDKRIGLQDVRDLLDVPAVAARVGIEPDALPGLFAWLSGAGVRWGLHEAHRVDLGLGAAGLQNTWLFGIRRLLLGYAAGDASGLAASFHDVQPYDAIGGLEASIVGPLIDLIERLERWWSRARGPATPVEWGARGRTLIADFFAPTDDRERLTIAALQSASSDWLQACDSARFVEPVPLSVLREAWLSQIDGLDASRRFLSGGVTFCTLLPLRSVPFDVVCLLGMNDGDFPRQGERSDFDLMALPGRARPGDRSRRDDDRYLMLEALLSARRVLSVSWCGRSARDNGVQPPSVLVAQLRDYLAAAWAAPDGGDVLEALTTQHPLQPFSRRYFEVGGPVTYAREWRAAHDTDGDFDPDRDAMPHAALVELPTDSLPGSLTVEQLVRLLRNPVREFFRVRLDVQVHDDDAPDDDHERFALGGLPAYTVRAGLLDDPGGAARGGVESRLDRRLERLRGSGRLPMRAIGERVVDELEATIEPMLDHWAALQRTYPNEMAAVPLRVETDGLAPRVDDWLEGLRTDGVDTVWITLTASRLFEKKSLRKDRLLAAWVRMLVASACGHRPDGIVIGCDTVLRLRPLVEGDARARLDEILAAWRDGMQRPLPFALKTALAHVAGKGKAASVYDGDYNALHAEGHEFCLERTFADYEALAEDGRFADLADRLFGPMARWIDTDVTIFSRADAVTEPEGAA